MHIALERSEALLAVVGRRWILDQNVPSRVEFDFPDANYVELTYEYLRVGPNGDFTDISVSNGRIWLAGDPIPFSDLIIW